MCLAFYMAFWYKTLTLKISAESQTLSAEGYSHAAPESQTLNLLAVLVVLHTLPSEEEPASIKIAEGA